jgi:truncated hemoglobin YjbI
MSEHDAPFAAPAPLSSAPVGRDKSPRRGRLAPDPALWDALGREAGLRQLLETFYARVYADERLAPFFAGVARSWAIDKQFNFLSSVITGARTYFGNHPRRAHHWMVISHELFDHREALLRACALELGVAPEMADRLRRIDEVFRRAIVKTEPRPLRIDGVTLPVDGREETVLDLDTLCDACGAEITAGEPLVYLVRAGQTLCAGCDG